jgi:hypothetical protein
MPNQIVRGTYSNDIVWKVPTGIDLTDKDTYTFADKGGILYIKNKKTGEEWEIEDYEQTEHDHKRAENPFTSARLKTTTTKKPLHNIHKKKCTRVAKQENRN